MNDVFPHLFQPIAIGNVEIPNRICMPALLLRYDFDRYREFYLARARGGAGLICCNLRTFDREGPGPRSAAIEHDGRIPALRQMTRVMHQSGSKVFAQLAARLNWVRVDGTTEGISPSGVNLALRDGTPDPRPLTLDDVEYIVTGFGEAARRAREAGFDGVELHALGGTSLLSQFISPVTNHRTDRYGGDLRARLTLLLETIASIRRLAGQDFPVAVRISGADFIPDGYGQEESKQVAVILAAGGVDALNVTTGWYRGSHTAFIQMGVPEGKWIYLAEGVKQAVSIPVIGGTNIRDPRHADDLLAAGKVDILYIARALVADPEFPNKAKEGRQAEIRPCLACCHCMDTNEEAGLECAVNPMAGHEASFPHGASAARKKVLVIGGGPAGMQAAITAAQRGHRVVLWERNDHLGGTLVTAALPPRKSAIGKLTGYLSSRMAPAGISVLSAHLATPDAVIGEHPDVVILATGAAPLVPDIPGVAGENVVMAADVLTGASTVGKSVVVVGGGMVGCEVAELLAEQGHTVTLLARRPRPGHNIGRSNRWVELNRLKELGVRSAGGVNVVEIKIDGVVGLQEGAERFFPADTVVLAVGYRSDDELLRALEGKIPALVAVGDCNGGSRIAGAMKEGMDAAFRL